MGRLIRFLRQCWHRTEISPEVCQLKNAIYNITLLKPSNLALYRLALQHKTAAATATSSNERLEFLGDAVLSLVVAEYLYKKYPLQTEGFLTDVRSRIVNRTLLNKLAQKMGIDQLLMHEVQNTDKRSLKMAYGNALEAFIGALYLDRGYENCRGFIVDRLLYIYVDMESLVLTDSNYKGQVIVWGQKNHKSVRFELADERCTHNQREFIVHLRIDGEVSGRGFGRSKKEAEQIAAQDALDKMGVL